MAVKRLYVEIELSKRGEPTTARQGHAKFNSKVIPLPIDPTNIKVLYALYRLRKYAGNTIIQGPLHACCKYGSAPRPESYSAGVTLKWRDAPSYEFRYCVSRHVERSVTSLQMLEFNL